MNDNPAVEPSQPVKPAEKSRANRKKYIVIAAIVILILATVGAVMLMTTKTGQATDAKTRVLLQTTMGNITIELFDDMPVTAGNFVKLVREGFYDGVIFHRVISDFMIQGGDPTGTGRGGPGYMITDEFTAHNKNDRGTIAMANGGPNTGGSQFFINLVDNNYLDLKHPVFGRVVGGMNVVDAIGSVQTGSNDRPLTDVKIIRATVV